MIDELRDDGLLKDNDSIERESDDLVKISGVIFDVDVVDKTTDTGSEI